MNTAIIMNLESQLFLQQNIMYIYIKRLPKNYDTVAVVRNRKLHLIITAQKVENIYRNYFSKNLNLRTKSLPRTANLNV